MEKNTFFLEKAEEELARAEEYLDIDMCDDGLVFFHLKNSAENYLKAIAQEFNLDTEKFSSLTEIVEELEKKTTIKFPEFIDYIKEMDETILSTGCSTNICFDMDFYGDFYEAVNSLKEFALKLLEE